MNDEKEIIEFRDNEENKKCLICNGTRDAKLMIIKRKAIITQHIFAAVICQNCRNQMLKELNNEVNG